MKCFKPNPVRSQSPSLLFPRDNDKNTFLHSIIKHNYKRMVTYKAENHCLFRALQGTVFNIFNSLLKFSKKIGKISNFQRFPIIFGTFFSIF